MIVIVTESVNDWVSGIKDNSYKYLANTNTANNH